MLSKFVGETEKNVRDLFADAENDQRTHGNGGDIDIMTFQHKYFNFVNSKMAFSQDRRPK